MSKRDDAIKAGRHTRTRLLQYTKTGETYWVDADLRPVHDTAGELEGYVLTLTDITTIREGQRRADAASAALRDAARMAGLGGWEIDFRAALHRSNALLGVILKLFR